MLYQPHRARLTITDQELAEIVLAMDEPGLERHRDWCDAGVVDESGAIHPVVVNMIAVAFAPLRGIRIERFDHTGVIPFQVGWTSDHRAVVMERIGDEIEITGTHLALLPSMIMQSVRPHPDRNSFDDRTMVMTSAGDVDDLLTDVEHGLTPTGELSSVFGGVRFGWRASGGFLNRPADTSVTCVDAGNDGRRVAKDSVHSTTSSSGSSSTTQFQLRAPIARSRNGHRLQE
ncbi:MAG: hypothetical protein ABIP17_10295 [Ilumatobacteraceae bacterium]